MNSVIKTQQLKSDRPLIILIADRNPRIRNFLKREMAAEGYEVLLAEKGRDILSFFQLGQPLDLIIIDPSLPDSDEIDIFSALRRFCPAAPVILHVDYPDETTIEDGFEAAAQVEKRGNSVETLKTIVSDIIGRNVRPATSAGW